MNIPLLLSAAVTVFGSVAVAASDNQPKLTGRTGQSIELTFDAPATRTLTYQNESSEKLRTLTDVQETTFNLIDLSPGTQYRINIGGEPGTSTATITAATTDKNDPATTTINNNRLEWGPFTHLPTFPDNVWYPTVEFHNGRLWLIESYHNQIHLSEMDAITSKIISTRPVVAQPFPGRETYLGIMDSAIHDGKLWIMYNEQDTQHPNGYHIRMSRQKIFSFDLDTGTTSPTIIVEPTDPEAGTWEGGIDVLDGKLWTACLDVWLIGGKRRTKVIMRELAGGKLGAPIVYDDCPTSYPYGPSISRYNDKLVLLFSDLIPYVSDKNREPLYYTTFDGKGFSPARNIYDEGRNRYAKGVQMGDRFVLAWKTNADWWKEFRYKYHDIGIGVLNPGTGDMRTVMAVDDRKYNSSPDLTLISPTHALMVFGKFDHEYNRADPSFNHGAYFGDIILKEDRP